MQCRPRRGEGGGANLRVGQHGEEGVNHANACTQHGHQPNNVASFTACGVDKRSGDSLGLEGQVDSGLVADEGAELAHKLAELVGAGALVTQEPAGGA